MANPVQPTPYRNLVFSDPGLMRKLGRLACQKTILEIKMEILFVLQVAEDLEAAVEKTEDVDLWDDIAIELSRSATRLRRRTRKIALRRPEQRPRPALVCPQCEFTLDEARPAPATTEMSEVPEAPSETADSMREELDFEPQGEETGAERRRREIRECAEDLRVCFDELMGEMPLEMAYHFGQRIAETAAPDRASIKPALEPAAVPGGT